ncbi:MAG TPA: hypothetical protein VJ746_02615, partial [Nitrospira sp.]|nr:hypothetical protein [Nitrospira sp.]
FPCNNGTRYPGRLVQPAGRRHAMYRRPSLSRRFALSGGVCFALLCLASPAMPSSVERIALQFDGSSCIQQRASISAALSGTHGIQAFDFNAVPGHIVVDAVRGFSETDLLRMIRGALTDDHCRIAVMRSCISSDFAAHSGHPDSRFARDPSRRQ